MSRGGREHQPSWRKPVSRMSPRRDGGFLKTGAGSSWRQKQDDRAIKTSLKYRQGRSNQPNDFPSDPRAKATHALLQARGFTSDPFSHRRPSDTTPKPGTRMEDRLTQLRPSEKEEGDDPNARSTYEGRRLYLGSLPYDMKPVEIQERLLKDHDCWEGFLGMDISIDPFTGRHPGYCFLEYSNRDQADLVKATLDGVNLDGRQVKCRDTEPRGQTLSGRRNDADEAAFNRWGKWVRDRPESGDWAEAGPHGGLQRYRDQETLDLNARRLYVGKLPRMHDQAMNFQQMKEIFDGFQVVCVSKRYHSSDRKEIHGRGDYCHVDFASRAEAANARQAMQGKTWRGLKLTVEWAKKERGSRSTFRATSRDSSITNRRTDTGYVPAATDIARDTR